MASMDQQSCLDISFPLRWIFLTIAIFQIFFRISDTALAFLIRFLDSCTFLFTGNNSCRVGSVYLLIVLDDDILDHLVTVYQRAYDRSGSNIIFGVERLPGIVEDRFVLVSAEGKFYNCMQRSHEVFGSKNSSKFSSSAFIIFRPDPSDKDGLIKFKFSYCVGTVRYYLEHTIPITDTINRFAVVDIHYQCDDHLHFWVANTSGDVDNDTELEENGKVGLQSSSYHSFGTWSIFLLGLIHSSQ